MKGRGGSRIGQREKWNHDVVRYHFGQPCRVLWRDWCPSEPLCIRFAKSLGMVALGNTSPQQGVLKKLAAGGCLLTSLPPWAARPSLVGIQVITNTYLLTAHIQATTMTCHFLLHIISHICLCFCISLASTLIKALTFSLWLLK